MTTRVAGPAVKRIFQYFLLLLVLFFSGCTPSLVPKEEAPVEPLVPAGTSTRLLSYYGNITAGLEINDLAVAAAGDKVLVAPRDDKVYLMHREGRILWEKAIEGQAFKMAFLPDPPAFALATREGKVIFFDGERQVVGERDLQRHVLDFAVSEEGSMAALLTLDPGEEPWAGGATLHLLDSRGFPLWEKPVALDPEVPPGLSVSHEGKTIIFIGRHQEEPALTCYNLKGQVIWKGPGYKGVHISPAGDVVAAISEKRLTVYDGSGERKWAYDTAGVILSDVLVSENGEHVLVYSSYSTGQENLFFFSASGAASPWKTRVPAQSSIAVSAAGERIAVITWRQYKEDFTTITFLDSQGEAINTMQVAGRGEKTALSADGSTLVISFVDGSIYFLNTVKAAGGPAQAQTSPAYKRVGEGDGEEYVTLYFYNSRASELIPVNRKVGPGESNLARAVEELVMGPRLGSGLSRTLPRDAKIEVHVKGHTAQIKLPIALARLGGAQQMEDMVRSLIYTASHFPRISWVQFRVEEGKEEEAGRYIDITRPMPVRRPGLSPGRQVLFSPVLSGNRYYLNVQETYILSTDRRDLAEKLLAHLIGDNRAFFPRDMQVNAVSIGIDTARIDLSADMEALQRLLRDRDRAGLLVDSVTLTLAENFSLNSVEIFVNGTAGDLLFPGLSRRTTRPYYVNPE